MSESAMHSGPGLTGSDLAAALGRAEAASAAKSRLLATVSHEIRTPLSGILGLAGVLLETDLSEEQETFVRAMKTSCDLLMGLVDDLLDFAKIEAGGFKLGPQPTNCEALIQDIVELLAARAHAKGIDIAGEVALDVPRRLLLDAGRLRQVLLNLAGNAIKFTEQGGVALRVEAATGGITLLVEDSGPGLSADDAQRLFAGLGPTDAGTPGSSGLGLPISREIVRQMGSDIQLEARPGGGTIFRFTLSCEALSSPPGRPDRRLDGQRALLLAPAGASPSVVAATLGSLGVEVRVTDNPNRATALAAAASAAGLPYRFALVDARIDADPAHLLTRLRQAAGDPIPVAILIEPGRRRDVEALRNAGFNAYLIRPVRRHSLARIAAELAGSPVEFRPDPSDQAPHTAAHRRNGRHLRILLVEDDQIGALLVRSVLERLGHTVVEAHDGRVAVAFAAASPPDRSFDAILIDLHIPGLGGMAVARAIRSIEAEAGDKRSLLLAITAAADTATRVEAAEAGFTTLLEKPLGPQKLAEVLERIGADSRAA